MIDLTQIQTELKDDMVTSINYCENKLNTLNDSSKLTALYNNKFHNNYVKEIYELLSSIHEYPSKYICVSNSNNDKSFSNNPNIHFGKIKIIDMKLLYTIKLLTV
jgi:hypothetical protein